MTMFSFPWLSAITLFSASTTLVHGLKYTLSEVDYNLNANTTATNPTDYWIEERTDHDYHKSPDNWRFPFYTVFLDRFVNGDPSNDNANKTVFETDMMSTQIRNGGDLQGVIDSLDYIAGMGVKVRTHRSPPPPLLSGVLLFFADLRRWPPGYLHCRIAFYQPAMGCRCVFGRPQVSPWSPVWCDVR